YHYLDLEQNLRLLYMDSLARVFARSLSEAEYLYAVSGIRFLATRGIYDAIDVDEAHLARLVLDGVFEDGRVPDNPDPGPLEASLDFSGEPASRVRLAEAGMKLFGERNFYSVGVSEICLEAGLSVGTFYQHFDTKEAFLDYLVKTIGHSLRYFLKISVRDGRDRLYREVLGMGFFARYFMARPEFYSIVRQAEFVTESWVRDYYNRIEQGYRRNLNIENPSRAGTTANFLMGLSHYMGIELIFSNRVSDPAALLKTLGGYLKEGLKP
ncbi:MAG: helix-turn-helix domain containing protein, partial [Spirochaetaceae bacterium]|nr:helix-turn-helix domain containing protein [Spirochaetaceae bacterium]